MFDLDQTAQLQRIVSVPNSEWDEARRAAFFEAAWNASIALPSPDAFVGPDGFSYLRLDIPAPGPFDSNSLANLARPCVEAGCGAALFAAPDAAEPAYVLPMGVLDSLLGFGDWRGDPVDLEEAGDAAIGTVTLAKGSRILTGAPSAEYLTPAAARALLRHLKERWDIVRPRVLLMMCQEFRPTRSLVLNVRRDRFESEEDAQYFSRCVGWFLPPSRVITLLPDDWKEGELFPLADFTQS